MSHKMTNLDFTDLNLCKDLCGKTMLIKVPLRVSGGEL